MNHRNICARLAGRIQQPAITRFAPSPTGYLHLGHVVNAVYVWGLAGVTGAGVHLRIENHDRIRSREAFEAALLEDLDWLGFAADSGRVPLDRQSDHPERYEAALSLLRRRHCVYACACSRRDIAGERYGGRCRTLGLAEGPSHSLRVAVEPGSERFDDLLLGPHGGAPQDQCGDLMVKDRDGQWTYQFAVTVDDIADGVTLVVRGLDLLSSTARQIRLAQMLGRSEPPQFAHHPLLLRPDGTKLSKADGVIGIRELRRAGLSGAEVMGRAAAAAGLVSTDRPLAATDVADLFL
jgi:glutamyl-tRNA synthetase/glutamyl-Q tRNA(Asp) synthetase